MSITIELPPEVEADLQQQARSQGVSLAEYLGQVLNWHRRHFSAVRQRELALRLLAEFERQEQEEAECIGRPNDLSPLRRAELWREVVSNLPRTPPLSDAAISREHIYDTRG